MTVPAVPWQMSFSRAGGPVWTFTGTHSDGTRVEVTGCDLFTFQAGKIAVKHSYRKNSTTI